MMTNKPKAISVSACVMFLAAAVAFGTALAENQTAAKPDFSQLLAENASWTVRLPEKERVEFKGVVNLDGAGGNGAGMLYPAPNAAGFLAAVITHGILLESTREHEKNQLQEEADKVLLPYQPVLTTFTSKELMEEASRQVPVLEHAASAASNEKIESDWVVASNPVFLMTQDEKSVMLANAISLYAHNAFDKPAYYKVIRVISAPRDEAEPRHYWIDEEGEHIKKLSELLVARSIDIAINDAAHAEQGSPAVFKTFRYAEGGAEKMERGQLIKEACGRALIKNLRGNLMSIPLTRHEIQPAGLDSCGEKF